SLIALLSYPFLVEPALLLRSQARMWEAGFWGFALACGGCVLMLWKVASSPQLSLSAAERASGRSSGQVPPPLRRYLGWILLALLASTMYLATTNEVCQDVAVIPFLWVVPLSLYLLSFILCFESRRWYRRRLWSVLSTVLMLGVCWLM